MKADWEMRGMGKEHNPRLLTLAGSWLAAWIWGGANYEETSAP